MNHTHRLVLGLSLLIVGCERAEVPTVPADADALAGKAAEITGFDLASVSVGYSHVCGLTRQGQAYCWGGGHPVPVPVADGLTFASVWSGGATTCGVTRRKDVYCWDAASHVVAPVSGGPDFVSVSPGEEHSCGLTRSGQAYCWGLNIHGQVGNGTTGVIPVPHPVPVSGGLSFVTLEVGYFHTCGLTRHGRAYCWGDNFDSNLGTGTPIANSPVPVPVAGSLTFASLTVGYFHTCGLTNQGFVYCWGLLPSNGGHTNSVPAAEAEGFRFASLSAGANHTCGVDKRGRAYCFGDGGGLGDGTAMHSATPVPVSGGFTFSSVSVGGYACGVTRHRGAWCWGRLPSPVPMPG